MEHHPLAPRYEQLAKLIIKKSPIAGYGLFALRRIAPRSHIGYYTGRVLTAKEAVCLQVLGADTSYWMHASASSRGRIIDGSPLENTMRYINHAPAGIANARAEEQGGKGKSKCIAIRALREIEPGEEILMDYGEDYWA